MKEREGRERRQHGMHGRDGRWTRHVSVDSMTGTWAVGQFHLGERREEAGVSGTCTGYGCWLYCGYTPELRPCSGCRD